ncbi:MAG: hypothetical protein ACT4QF_19715 [Sporichthyaceae bacterium]
MATRRTAITAVLASAGLMLGTSPAEAITAPEAQAVAAAGVVRSTDLPPGYFGPPPGIASDPDGESEREFYACLGSGQPAYLARNRGGTFLFAEKVGTPQAVEVAVHSTADVADAQEAAVADQENLRTSKGARCYKKRLESHLRAKRLTPKRLSVDLVRAVVPGADEAWVYRVEFAVTRQGEELERHGFVVGSRVGEALLEVSYLAGGRKADLATVLELAAKPVARVRQVART